MMFDIVRYLTTITIIIIIGFLGLNIPLNDGKLSLGFKLIITGVFTGFIILGFKFLYHLQRLFNNFSQGNIFTAVTINQIKQLGLISIYFGS